MDIQTSLHDNKDSNWVQLIEELYEQLDFPNNPDLFPPQFIQVTFPKIGGQITVVRQKEQLIGVGFLFPHAYNAKQTTYLLHYHPIAHLSTNEPESVPAKLIPLLQSELNGAHVILFDPATPKRYWATGHAALPAIEHSIQIDRPTEAEAEEIRQVHQQIWGSPPGYLYPAAMHTIAFGAGTSLIARAVNEKSGNQVAGFLLGFYRFSGSQLPTDWHERLRGDWRIESQSMGILPPFRGERLGYRLKQAQAQLAREQGIHIVHWTADPLQFPNAALNFGLLRAIAFDFHADLYPFRNELNRVAASRFSLTWLINAHRVRQTDGQRTQVIDLSAANGSMFSHIVRINDGPKQIVAETDAAQIAIEIPADWSAIQLGNLDEALQWRATTDSIFAQFVGRADGQYVITDVGVDGPCRYLIGNQVNDALWQLLSTDAMPSS